MLASQPRKGPVCNPCQADTTGLGSVAQRGSTAAPLVQRGDSMAGPCRGDCKARQMIQLGAVIGCGSTAWPSRHGTGSTAWERRLAVNPSVGVRRQLPLHKGAFFAARETTGPGSVVRCGSTAAPLVQRGDSMAGPCRGDCKARQMIQLGAVIGCGSTAWERRHSAYLGSMR